MVNNYAVDKTYSFSSVTDTTLAMIQNNKQLKQNNDNQDLS